MPNDSNGRLGMEPDIFFPEIAKAQENVWPVAAVERAAARWVVRSAGCGAGSATARNRLDRRGAWPPRSSCDRTSIVLCNLITTPRGLTSGSGRFSSLVLHFDRSTSAKQKWRSWSVLPIGVAIPSGGLGPRPISRDFHLKNALVLGDRVSTLYNRNDARSGSPNRPQTSGASHGPSPV